MGKLYVWKKERLEKDKRPQSPGNPPQDVDDLIFSGQTDARISQR